MSVIAWMQFIAGARNERLREFDTIGLEEVLLLEKKNIIEKSTKNIFNFKILFFIVLYGYCSQNYRASKFAVFQMIINDP